MPVMTQSAGKSTTTYFWAIIFFWNENLEHPFAIVPLSKFDKDNFPFHLITGPLSYGARKDKYYMDQNDCEFSIFAKVQEG